MATGLTRERSTLDEGPILDGPGRPLSPNEIAGRLEAWRSDVLREMSRKRSWSGASAADCEDQFQDVALVLTTRRINDDEHLQRALWTGLGFRAKDFWKSPRRRELSVGEFFDSIGGDDRSARFEDEALTAADLRQVADCLAELDERERSVYRLVKGDGLSRRKAAKALRITEADVLRAIYSAQRKVDNFVLLMTSGRLCAKRGPAVEALARETARGTQLAQARAHLSHCHDCLADFRSFRQAFGGRVAAALPAPEIAARHGEVVDKVVEPVRQAAETVKHHVLNAAGKLTPTRTHAAEAVAGGGGASGAAVGAKIAVGLCVGAAAGGTAICAHTLGALSAPTSHPTALSQKASHHHVRAKAASATTPSPPPAPVTTPVVTTPSTTTPESSKQPAAQQTTPQQPQSDFFGDKPSNSTQSETYTPPASSATGSSGQETPAPAPSSGGGEFTP